MKSESFGQAFLYAEDLLIGQQYRTAVVEIEEYLPEGTLKSADGRLIDKPSLKFKGKEKLLVLCKTNAKIIHFITGEPGGQKWVGTQITLQPRFVQAFGETVVALRIIPPKGVMVRKKVLEQLGKPATWTAPPTETPK
jgi:hypothetical protein